MGEQQHYTAQEISQSANYSPGPKAIVNSIYEALDLERKYIDAAFASMEGDVASPKILEVQAQNISVGGPPAALVITGAGFGTDNTKVYLEVGPDTVGPFQALVAGHTDTNATFNISAAAGLTASRVIQLTVYVMGANGGVARSKPVAVPTVA